MNAFAPITADLHFGLSWPLAWEAHRDLYSRDACLQWIIQEAGKAGAEDWMVEAQSALDTGDNEAFDDFCRWNAEYDQFTEWQVSFTSEADMLRREMVEFEYLTWPAVVADVRRVA